MSASVPFLSMSAPCWARLTSVALKTHLAFSPLHFMGQMLKDFNVIAIKAVLVCSELLICVPESEASTGHVPKLLCYYFWHLTHMGEENGWGVLSQWCSVEEFDTMWTCPKDQIYLNKLSLFKNLKI